MPIRDGIGSELASQTEQTLTLAASSTLTSTAIDTKGFNAGFGFILKLSGALAAGDDVTYKVQTCDTSGGTYADIPTEAYTPSSNENREVKNPNSGYSQVFGFIDSERYVKVQIVVGTLDTARDLTLIPVGKSDKMPSDYLWDPDIEGDGHP